MKIEKEPVQLKSFQLNAGDPAKVSPGTSSVALAGGTLMVAETRKSFSLSPLQFSYLEVLKNAGTIESLVQFFLGQGWLVNFRELFSLLHFLVQENILTNPSFKKYFLESSDAEELATAMPTTTLSSRSSSPLPKDLQISQLPFFRSLEKSVAQYLLQGATRLSIPAQTRITKSGDRDRALYILLQGQASIYKVQSEKQRQLVAVLSSGSIFGEKAFLLNQPRSADVITSTPVDILKIPHLPEFDTFIKSDKAHSLQHRFSVLQALASSPFFKDLPSDSLDSLIFSGKLVKADAHQVLFREQHPGNTCYVLVQGSVLISQKNQNINVLDQGSCFGEISLLMSGGVRTATVTTQRPSVLLEIQQGDFYRVLGQNIILAKEIESLAAQRLQNDALRR